MDEKLNAYFQAKKLNKYLIDKLEEICVYKTYQSGDILLNIGQHTDYICLIIQGIVRGFYIDEEGNDIIKCFSMESEKRIATFSGMNAKSRYMDLLDKQPMIIERVKQEYIASYLGITPSSLSRIKRSLAK